MSLEYLGWSVETSERMTFWGQEPEEDPKAKMTDSAEAGGEARNANHSYGRCHILPRWELLERQTCKRRGHKNVPTDRPQANCIRACPPSGCRICNKVCDLDDRPAMSSDGHLAGRCRDGMASYQAS